MSRTAAGLSVLKSAGAKRDEQSSSLDLSSEDEEGEFESVSDDSSLPETAKVQVRATIAAEASSDVSSSGEPDVRIANKADSSVGKAVTLPGAEHSASLGSTDEDEQEFVTASDEDAPPAVNTSASVAAAAVAPVGRPPVTASGECLIGRARAVTCLYERAHCASARARVCVCVCA